MKNRYIKLTLLLAAPSLLFTSCYKKFDPASYAPPLEIGGYTSASEVAQSNLIAYWPFDGDLKEQVSGTSATGTGTDFAGGIKGQALQGALDGYVVATPSAAVTGMHSFTIAYWINTPAPSVGIIGTVQLAQTQEFWGNIDMFFENGSSNANGNFKVHVRNGVTDTWFTKDKLLNLFDTWTAMAVSYDEATSTFALYVNGSKVATGTTPGFGPLNFANIGNLVFGTVQFQTNPSQTSGATAQGWASFMTGRMDEVRIYNKALSDVEISSLVTLEGRGK